MKISQKKLRIRLLKKTTVIATSVIMTVSAGYFIGVSYFVENEQKTIDVVNVNNETLEMNLVDENIQKITKNSKSHLHELKRDLDEAHNNYVKVIKPEQLKVKFEVIGDRIRIYAYQATLKDVIDAFINKFDVKLIDHTSSFESLSAKKSFHLSGTLFELVDEVLRKYGYDNFVINSNIDSSGMNLVSVYLLEPPLNLEEPSETKAVIASVDNNATINPIMKRLKQQALPVSSANLSATSSVNGSTGVNNDLALAKRELDASQNVITFNAGVDLSNGVPEEFQQQLQQLTQGVTNDAQGLANALANAEAQLKANQFLNGQ